MYVYKYINIFLSPDPYTMTASYVTPECCFSYPLFLIFLLFKLKSLTIDSQGSKSMLDILQVPERSFKLL